METVDQVRDWGTPGGRCRMILRLLGRGRRCDCEMTDIERPQRFRYLAHEEGRPTSRHDCRFAETAGGTRVEISARHDGRHGWAGLYDRFVVPWALRRMLNRQMASVSAALTARRRPPTGTP